MRFSLKILVAALTGLLLLSFYDCRAEQDHAEMLEAERQHHNAYQKWAEEHPNDEERLRILTTAATRPTTLPFRWGASGKDWP
jgi:hypothetical protein